MDILDRIEPHLSSEDIPTQEFVSQAFRSFPAFKPEWPKRVMHRDETGENFASESYHFDFQTETLEKQTY